MSKILFKPVVGLTPQHLLVGCAPSGGLYHTDIPTSAVVEMVYEGVTKHGIVGIDTAPWYGCGRSERDLGEAFRQHPQLATGAGGQQAYVITKAGRVVVPRSSCSKDDPRVAWGDTCYKVQDTDGDVCLHDYTAAGIRASYEGSVQRLGVRAPTLRTMRLHDCETPQRFEEFMSQGGLEAFVALRTEGKVERLSLGMNEPEYILKLLNACPKGTFNDVMMAGCWNLVEVKGLRVLERCQELGIPVHVAGVFGAGLLWGASKYKYAKADPTVLARRDRWEAIATANGCAEGSLPSLALMFAYAPAVVSHVAIGCASAKELEGCVNAMKHLPTQEQFESIVRQAVRDGLLPSAPFSVFSDTSKL